MMSLQKAQSKETAFTFVKTLVVLRYYVKGTRSRESGPGDATKNLWFPIEIGGPWPISLTVGLVLNLLWRRSA